jgi:hypothetical protein
MCHRWPYQNQNVVNLTGHEGVYQMPILSWMSNWGKIWWKNANFRWLIIKFYSCFGNSCPTRLWQFKNQANSENSKNAVLLWAASFYLQKFSNAVEWTIWNLGWTVGHHFWRFWTTMHDRRPLDCTMHSTCWREPSALIYYSSRVHQAAGTVGAYWQICWGQFKGQNIGFLVGGAGVYIQYHWLLSWSESLCAYILLLSLILHHMYLIRHPLYICLTLNSWPSWLQSTDPLRPSFKAVTRVWC